MCLSFSHHDLMTSSNHDLMISSRPHDIILGISSRLRRERGRERARGEEEGAVPHRHLSAHTPQSASRESSGKRVCVCVCVCVHIIYIYIYICMYMYMYISGRRGRGSERMDNGMEEAVLVQC